MRGQSDPLAIVRAAALRARAALCRRAAGTPTVGGHESDRLLLDLAESLEREANALAPRGRPNPSGSP
jgi:hypothetical protein